MDRSRKGSGRSRKGSGTVKERQWKVKERQWHGQGYLGLRELSDLSQVEEELTAGHEVDDQVEFGLCRRGDAGE